MHIIDKIVSAVGRRIDESSPMVDARLLDGSRVNIVIPPLAVDGPLMSIRRFGTTPITADDLLRYRSLTPQMLETLRGAVRARLNICLLYTSDCIAQPLQRSAGRRSERAEQCRPRDLVFWGEGRRRDHNAGGASGHISGSKVRQEGTANRPQATAWPLSLIHIYRT